MNLSALWQDNHTRLRTSILIAFLAVTLLASLGSRLTNLPTGLLIDVILASGLFLVFLKYRIGMFTSHPIMMLLLIWFIFCLGLAFLYPEKIVSWVYAIRNYSLRLFSFALFYFMIRKQDDLNNLHNFFLLSSIPICIYGLLQFAGFFPGFDQDYIASNVGRSERFSHDGKTRIFSIFSDPTTLGMYLSIMFFFAAIPLVRARRIINRGILAIAALMTSMVIVLAYSRTPYVLVLIGCILFLVFRPSKQRFMAFATLGLIAFIFVMGSNSSISDRLKSGFQLKDNVSWEIRNVDRNYITPKILERPLGYGLGITGYTGHKFYDNSYLSNFQTNNGYLKLSVETGWLGLLLFTCIIAVILLQLFRYFLLLKSRGSRNQFLMYFIPAILLVVGNFPQEPLTLNPLNVIFMYLVAAACRVYEMDKEH